MDFFLSKYKKYFAIALMLLVTVPCSVKKELTCLSQTETSQQSSKSKVSCSIYYELKRTDRKGKIQKQIIPFHFSSLRNDFFAYNEKIILPDFFNDHKEKIPSYLLFRRFLI